MCVCVCVNHRVEWKRRRRRRRSKGGRGVAWSSLIGFSRLFGGVSVPWAGSAACNDILIAGAHGVNTRLPNQGHIHTHTHKHTAMFTCCWPCGVSQRYKVSWKICAALWLERLFKCERKKEGNWSVFFSVILLHIQYTLCHFTSVNHVGLIKLIWRLQYRLIRFDYKYTHTRARHKSVAFIHPLHDKLWHPWLKLQLWICVV